MSAENTLDFATLWRTIEKQEKCRRRLEHRMDENLAAADALLSLALAEPVVKGSGTNEYKHRGLGQCSGVTPGGAAARAG